MQHEHSSLRNKKIEGFLSGGQLARRCALSYGSIMLQCTCHAVRCAESAWLGVDLGLADDSSDRREPSGQKTWRSTSAKAPA